MVVKKFKSILYIFLSRNFFLYLIFAGVATLFDWSTFYASVYALGYHYLLGTIFGFLIGSAINFSLNKYLNFKNKYQIIKNQFALFLVVAAVGLTLSLLIMLFFVGFIHINKMVSRIITTGIVLMYNFLGHKYLTFKILK